MRKRNEAKRLSQPSKIGSYIIPRGNPGYKLYPGKTRGILAVVLTRDIIMSYCAANILFTCTSLRVFFFFPVLVLLLLVISAGGPSR